MAATVERVSPRQAREHREEGALLVCAYDSDDKFRHFHLDGAIALSELRAREGEVPRGRELIFYCA